MVPCESGPSRAAELESPQTGNVQAHGVAPRWRIDFHPPGARVCDRLLFQRSADRAAGGFNRSPCCRYRNGGLLCTDCQFGIDGANVDCPTMSIAFSCPGREAGCARPSPDNALGESGEFARITLRIGGAVCATCVSWLVSVTFGVVEHAAPSLVNPPSPSSSAAVLGSARRP